MIVVTDKSDTLEEIYGDFDKSSIEVGIFSDAGPHPTAKVHMATLLAWHELQADRVGGGSPKDWQYPKRPVLQASEDKIKAVLRSELPNRMGRTIRNAFRFLKKPTDRQMFGDAPRKIEEAVKSTFGDSSLLERNADSWIRRKKKNSPLEHHGNLREAISHRIVRRK
jgi:hypothetical protein